ncbi:MAG: PAS domain S-box protein, partial [Acidimicrobiia bacterium]|nr:PAS domain S-box protein [Acidimicrobiia bacterium]
MFERKTVTRLYRIQHTDGKYRWITDTIEPIVDLRGDAIGYGGVARDVTEQRQLEAQLQQSQKMESVGRLAGGIAHDFNNLLTVILGMADFASARVIEGDPLKEELQEICRAGERAAALTRQLLAFSRRQVLQPKILNLNTVLNDMLSLLQRLLREDINVVFVPGTDLSSVRADPGQIEQVTVNLAVNARDAMPTGGTLTIETRDVMLDEAYAEAHPGVQPG